MDAEDIVNNAYETRLVLMLETDPGSNKYRQIGLSQEDFGKLSDLLHEVSKTTTNADVTESIHFNMSDWTTDMPEDIQSHYRYD